MFVYFISFLSLLFNLFHIINSCLMFFYGEFSRGTVSTHIIFLVRSFRVDFFRDVGKQIKML